MEMRTGQVLSEGKTKKIIQGKPGFVEILNKDDITAGDGAIHCVIPGKGAWSNQTTSNVFRLLNAAGLPTAFVEEIDETSFLAEQCQMILFEMIARGEAHGSYCERHLEINKGYVFSPPLIEFFAKTKGPVWSGISIPMDDPFIEIQKESVLFYIPHWTKEQKKESELSGRKDFLVGQKPFLEIPLDVFLAQAKSTEKNLVEMERITREVFIILRAAWKSVDIELVDGKIEFGINQDGKLVIADVIDADSCRLLKDGKNIDKQVLRDGGNPEDIARNFKLIAQLSGRFDL